MVLDVFLLFIFSKGHLLDETLGKWTEVLCFFFSARSDDLLVGCFNMVSPNVACVLQVIYPRTKVSGHVARNFQ